MSHMRERAMSIAAGSQQDMGSTRTLGLRIRLRRPLRWAVVVHEETGRCPFALLHGNFQHLPPPLRRDEATELMMHLPPDFCSGCSGPPWAGGAEGGATDNWSPAWHRQSMRNALGISSAPLRCGRLLFDWWAAPNNDLHFGGDVVRGTKRSPPRLQHTVVIR